jgi:hypothetical protein
MTQNEGQADYVLRKGKQCRERWMCTLDPAIRRGEWTVREEISFLRKWLKLGNCWKKIANITEDRGESQCKNRFKLILRREGLEDIANDYTQLKLIIKTNVLKRLRLKLDLEDGPDDTESEMTI